MKILLAGGSGLIGSAIYEYLQSKYSLLSIAKSSKADRLSINFDCSNLGEVDNFVKNCQNFNALIFLIGLAHNKGKLKDYKYFKKINYYTLVHLLSSLKKYKKMPDKIILASTISVYGERLDTSIYDESSRTMPKTPYATTKLEAENYLLNQFPSKSWILRLSPIYSSKFMLNIQRRSKINKLFFRVGKGKKNLSMCNLENIPIIVQKIIKNRVPKGIYNVSDQLVYTYNDLLRIQDARYILPIPNSIIKLFYYYGVVNKNLFLRENSIKLLSNNIYPSTKLAQYVDINFTLKKIKNG